MRGFIWIPMLILAGLAVAAFITRPEPLPTVPNAYISGAASGVRAAQAYLLPVTDPGYAPVRNTAVDEPTLDANAAILYHVESDRRLYERNPDAAVPIASLTKMLTALVVDGMFAPDEVVTVASDSVRVDGQKQTLYLEERIAVRDLVAMMLVESSNDAAYALANHARLHGTDLVAEMNARAWSLGMRSCAFTDPAGLDDGAFCTASDLIRLVRAALRTAPHLWPIMASPVLTVASADGTISHTVKSTNELFDEIPGIMGGKTGNTDGALGCMILVVKTGENRDTLVSVVLGSRTRFQDTRTLIRWAGEAYRWQ